MNKRTGTNYLSFVLLTVFLLPVDNLEARLQEPQMLAD